MKWSVSDENEFLENSRESSLTITPEILDSISNLNFQIVLYYISVCNNNSLITSTSIAYCN